MKLAKYSPNSLLSTLNRDSFFAPVESVFNEFFNDFFADNSLVKKISTTKYPKFDIIEYDDRIEFEGQMAGMKKEDIDIEIKKGTDTNYLIVKGCSKNENKEKNGEIILKELSKSSFSRTFGLSSNLDCDISNVDASFEDGVLKLIIKKKEVKEKETKKIKIK